MTGGGLKKCIPTTRSGLRAAPATRCDQERRGVGGQDTLVGNDRLETLKQLPLDPEALGGGFDDQLAVSQVLELGGRMQCLGGRDGLRLSPASTLNASLELAADTGQATLEAPAPSGSCRSVRAPARQASWAMPAPIVPAPATPITSGGLAARSGTTKTARAR